MHKWGVRVGEEVFLARVRGESVGEVFPARAASDQSLQPGPKPGLSLTLIYLRTNNIKKNILRSLGRTDVTAQMAKGAAERWDGEEAGGSGLQRTSQQNYIQRRQKGPPRFQRYFRMLYSET